MNYLSTTQKERIERIASQHFDSEMDPAGVRECKAALTAFAEEEQREREKGDRILSQLRDHEQRLQEIEVRINPT